MNNYFKTLLLSLSSIVILGCGGVSPKTSSSSMPDWYLNKPMSNSLYYYGVGTASTKEGARAAALAQIGGEISTKVSHSLDMSVSEHNDALTSDTKIATKTSIETMKFTGVTVNENAYVNGEFYSYVQVDRDTLFADQKREFDEKYNKLTSFYSSAKSRNVFSLIKNKKKIETSLIELRGKLTILKTIKSDFNQAKYASVLTNISNDTRDAVADAMVYVTTSNARPFKAVLKQYISSYGMTLVDSPKRVQHKKNLLKVNIRKTSKKKNVKTSDPRLRGASFADVVITLTTKDFRGKVIAQNRVQFVNISKDGYKAASVKTQKFEREIKRRGILNILLDKSSK